MSCNGSKKNGQTNGSGENSRKRKAAAMESRAAQLPNIIPSEHLMSQISPLRANESSLPQRSSEVTRPELHNINTQTQHNHSQTINEDSGPQVTPPATMTPATSASAIGDGDGDKRLWIEPDEDGFKPHKPAIECIASCIRSKFKLARPSWKKFPDSVRLFWFEKFKKKFRWLPCYGDTIWRNFQKRGSARMSQLFLDVRKDLTIRPEWMGDAVFKEMKEIWESPEFKSKSEQNKKNRDSKAGASLHTGGCIPHRMIWQRMKEENNGQDPSISDFYFRTHRKDKDKSWVNENAEAAYNNFEKKKQEILASQSATPDEADSSAGQSSQLNEMDIWVQSVGGKKKGRVAGLGSLGRSVKVSSQSTSTMPEVSKVIRSQVHTLNAELFAQLQKEREENKELRKEFGHTNKRIDELINSLGYKASSSRAQVSSESESDDENNGEHENMYESDDYDMD